MSEDTRSIAPRSRKPHRPILVVANPSPDSDSGSDNGHGSSLPYANHRPYHHPYNHPVPSPTAPSPSRDKSVFISSSYREPGPLTTANLPTHHRHNPASQSNPALSSPSGTSSPPPSTPGQSVPPMDFADASSRKECVVGPSYSSEALLQQQTAVPSRTGNFFGKLKSHIPRPHLHHDRRLSSGSSRPATSPVTLTPSEPYSGRSIGDVRSPPSDRSLILVTGDSDQYYTVDISGFRDAAFIKELIFSKLRIGDAEQSEHSFYRTEIDAYALGGALTDDQLYELCRDQADAKGSLKFLVANSSAVVHEPAPSSPVTSPTVSAVPPPVLPFSFAPSRSRRRSQSRHESVSSASERAPAEDAAGYDPSLSDDVDATEADSHRSTLRAPPRLFAASGSTASLVPPSPQSRRGNARAGSPATPARTQSPSPYLSPDRPHPLSADPRRLERGRPNAHQTPPSRPFLNSPDRSRTPFDEDTATGTWAPHVRAGSDAAADREKVLQKSESQLDLTNRQLQAQRRDGVDKGKRKGVSAKKETEQSKPVRDPSWIMVDRSSPSQENSRPQRSARDRDAKYSPRYQPTTNSLLSRSHGLSNAPRQPPPAPPGGDREPRSGRHAVPPGWAVAWRGPSRADQAASSAAPLFNLKMAKSVDNMRDKYGHSHPGALTPGSSRRVVPPLPTAPSSATSIPSSLLDNLTPPHSGYTSGDSTSFSPRGTSNLHASPETPKSHHEGLRSAIRVSPTSHWPGRPLPTQTPQPSGSATPESSATTINPPPSRIPQPSSTLPEAPSSSNSALDSSPRQQPTTSTSEPPPSRPQCTKPTPDPSAWALFRNSSHRVSAATRSRKCPHHVACCP
ncbi:hypothetical protein BV25DRAFT_577881 [Artomyces pyxidatus]|uniref:Uncharacterized protein n=1 Tax=Artomyces pyxidatus TaxID=48021 RepID=A0ACB8TJ17_9AGAM|nr:hypothetical protein BV25DRAFT_577881 [Artomyces pyxidatus]